MMKLLSMEQQGKVRIGTVVERKIIDLNRLYTRYLKREEGEKHAEQVSEQVFLPDMIELISKGRESLEKGREMVSYAEDIMREDEGKVLVKEKIIYSLRDELILAPIPTPRKNIVCLAVNYAAHLEEGAKARGEKTVIPSDPIFFSKPPTSVTGSYSKVVKPRVTEELDYEVELAIIIGKGGKYISESKVKDHIFGYMAFNDFTARDLQRRHRQFLRGKGLDTFAPCGPFIVTKDQIRDPQDLELRLKVNGEIRQDSNTRNMIFKIPEIVNILSSGMTLEPGYIIATGTPAGGGSAMTPPRFLRPGDLVETSVERIGTMRNQIVSES